MSVGSITLGIGPSSTLFQFMTFGLGGSVAVTAYPSITRVDAVARLATSVDAVAMLSTSVDAVAFSSTSVDGVSLSSDPE